MISKMKKNIRWSLICPVLSVIATLTFIFQEKKLLKIVTYTLYLITITDIEKVNVEVHRLVFDNHAECVALAKAINQVRDPISTKKNCRSVQNFYWDLP